MTRNTLILILCAMFSVSGCAQSSKAVTLEPERYLQIESPPLLHLVKSPRETLGLIAEWYTGNFKNWDAIANYNGKSGSSIVRLGEKIFIPQEMLVREDALELQPQIKQQESKVAKIPLKSPTEALPVPIIPADSTNSSGPRYSIEASPTSNKSMDDMDLDELSEMVDLFDEGKDSSIESEISKNEERKKVNEGQTKLSTDPVTDNPGVEVMDSEQHDTIGKDPVGLKEEYQEKEEISLPLLNKDNSNIPLEIDDLEKRRIELLQELLRK